MAHETVSLPERPSSKMEKRTWNTPAREPWNEMIRCCLKSIDQHNQMYFETGNSWHLAKAQELRNYVTELKCWLARKEAESTI